VVDDVASVIRVSRMRLAKSQGKWTVVWLDERMHGKQITNQGCKRGGYCCLHRNTMRWMSWRASVHCEHTPAQVLELQAHHGVEVPRQLVPGPREYCSSPHGTPIK